MRARIVLTCAEGGRNTEVAAKLGLDRQTVGKWRRPFMEQRVMPH
ncbi:helix-turn-helix domain-containing protein [Bradyrhizobium genosp. SA-3]